MSNARAKRIRRERFLEAEPGAVTVTDVARQFGVVEETVRRWIVRRILTSLQPAAVAAFTPPVRSGQPRSDEYEPALNGYAPDTSTIFDKLMKRRQAPYSSRHTASQEARQIALFLSDPDYTREDVLRCLRCDRDTTRAIFAHWGANIRTRRLIG